MNDGWNGFIHDVEEALGLGRAFLQRLAQAERSGRLSKAQAEHYRRRLSAGMGQLAARLRPLMQGGADADRAAILGRARERAAALGPTLAPPTPQVAYHEAGHGVASLALGYRVKAIDCWKDEGTCLVDERVLGHRVHWPAILAAGASAVDIWRQEYLESGRFAAGTTRLLTDGREGSDLDKLARHWSETPSYAPSAQEYARDYVRAATDLLLRNWPAVEAVAEALLAHGSLTGEQVHAIVRNTNTPAAEAA